MKNEKIIANIQQYVSTLEAKKQRTFEFILTSAEKERTTVQGLFKLSDEPLVKLAAIVQELTQDMKEAEQKASKGGSFVKRSKQLNKLLSKCSRESLKNGFYEEINGEKMQCSIVDGFYAFILRNKLDIPMQNTPSFTVQKALPDYSNFDVCTFDIAEIKTALKLSKAKKEPHCKVEVNGRFYEAQYFINVVEILGGDVKMYHDTKNIYKPAVFESENGLAILCAVRP